MFLCRKDREVVANPAKQACPEGFALIEEGNRSHTKLTSALTLKVAELIKSYGVDIICKTSSYVLSYRLPLAAVVISSQTTLFDLAVCRVGDGAAAFGRSVFASSPTS